jgi:hypothetical protein
MGSGCQAIEGFDKYPRSHGLTVVQAEIETKITQQQNKQNFMDHSNCYRSN